MWNNNETEVLFLFVVGVVDSLIQISLLETNE